MSFGRMSSWQTAAWMGELDIVALYAALASTNPFDSDAAAAEMLGGGYARQLCIFGEVAPSVRQCLVPLVFTGLPIGSVIAGYMLFDDPFAGNFRAGYVLDDPITLNKGGKYTIPAGELEYGIDAVAV